MPSIQVINTTRDKPEPTAVPEFFSKLNKVYKDEEDRVEIGKLLDEYKANRQDANAWENLQLGLEQSNISPTKRLATQQSLIDIQKTITDKDNKLNAQFKSEIERREKQEKEAKLDAEKIEKQAKDQASIKALYLENGSSEEEAERNSKVDSLPTAIAKFKEKNKDRRADEKVNKEKAEEEKSKSLTQNAFNNMVKLIPKVGRSGAIQSKVGYGAGPYAEFTSLSGALESLLVEKVNKGALSNTRFKYITENLLPKPSDTQSEIKGKLKGLATILDLDPSLLGEQTEPNKDPHEGKVQVKDPQGILRWVPKELAEKLKA